MVAYKRFGIWTCVTTIFYVLYGVHSTYHAEEILEMIVVDNVNVNSSTQQIITKVDIQLV